MALGRVVFMERMKRWLLSGLMLVSGCGPSALTNAALNNDLVALRTELERSRAAGQLDARTVRELALAVARRELVSSQGEAAVARIRELRPCLGQLKADAQERAESDPGAGGATAALALLEGGYVTDEEWALRYAQAPDPMWRAVAARATRSGEQVAKRAQWFLDGDLRVRRAALYAALDAPQLGELEAALEAARLDPDPLARSVAIRVVGKLNDARAPRGLRDLWSSADVESRQVVVEAWASSPQPEARIQLLWVLETQSGLPQIVAAARLQASNPSVPAAIGVLRRAMQDAPGDEQRLALRLAPRDKELLVVVEGLSKSADAEVAVAAAQALLSYDGKRDLALGVLRTLAKGRHAGAASQARASLVASGESALLADIRAELNARLPEQRATAGEQLVALSDYASAATRLADDAATVRTRVACSILTHK